MPFLSPNSPADPSAFRSNASHIAVMEGRDFELLEQTFALLPDVISIYDVDSQQTVYSNRSFKSVLGYGDQSPIDGLLHPDDVSALAAHFQRMLTNNGEDTGDVAYRLKHADGAWKWFSERQVVFKRHGNGAVARILKTARYDMGIARNITQQMEKITVDLTLEREQSRTLSQFINTISHEIRTPLAVINTSLYLIKKTNDPVKQGERLQLIEHQTAQLARLVEQMTVLLQVDSLHGTLITVPLSLNKMVAKLQHDYETALAKKGLTLELQLDANLPILNMEYDLSEALQNVFDNAITYTAAGGIVVSTATQDHEIILTVSDSGTGIDPEDLPHLFERFYSVEVNKRRKTIAAGLGLLITQRIMELSGGRIEIESQLGAGSAVRLIWPLRS